MWIFSGEILTPEELAGRLAAGGRVVAFEYCISFLVITLRRTSRPHLLRPGQRAFLRGLPYVGVSLLLGWWGLPWGLILTPVTVLTNLWGGRDMTVEVRQELERQGAGL